MKKDNHLYESNIHIYDSSYEADNEYDVNDDILEPIVKIDDHIFINIGIYMTQLYNHSEDNIFPICYDIIALHQSKVESTPTFFDPTCHTISYISSSLFSISSNDTDDTLLQYYISEDEIFIELT